MSRKSFMRALALVLILGFDSLAFQNGHRVEGTVTDKTGAAVIGAEVAFTSGSFSVNQKTDVEGRFTLDVPSTAGKITVRAQGFAPMSREWSAQDKALEFVLEPDPISEEVIVTAARTEMRVSDTGASLVVLSGEDLSATAALTLDDALRQAVGFSLFRRSGSRTANPTSQGVSLRGVGASGASRAVVLSDSIPLNDPFGGWVYWDRIPREAISRVELVRGGESNLYGTDALGGAINIIRREPRDIDASVETSFGNQKTPYASFFAGGRVGQLGARISGEIFHTDGYIIVDENDRGAADTAAGSEHTSLDLTLERLFSSGRVFLSGSVFGEERENGTPLQQNRTHIRQFAIGADWQSAQLGSFLIRGYASTQVFDQDFSAVAAGRNTETLTRSQRVPAQQTGATFQWSRAAGSRNTLVAGVDAREVRGASDELVFIAGNLSSAIGSGGRERTTGVFGQDIIRITNRFIATVSARVDHWRNFDALSTSQPLATPGPTRVTAFDDRDETAFSPRLSLLYKLTDNFSLTASGYRAFRAPTLNELYRAFRVGNVFTLANENLRAERLAGGEWGAHAYAFNRKLNLRGAFFWSEVTRPVANVTISFTPALITRRRENLGRTRSRGFEIEGEARVTSEIVITAGYQFVDATVLEFPANTALEGLLIPQVPRHQFTFQARYSNPRVITLGFQGRAIGSQFDDDRNQFELDKFFTLDLLASRRIKGGFEVFGAVENVFNERYDIGRTPVRTIGPPALVRVGVRFNLGSK
ncbi:MAG: TonB-dependent receptor [Acidobacteriota bacterium]